MDIKSIASTNVHLPLPWLVGIIVTLLFNAGVMYQQFSDMKLTTELSKETWSALNGRVNLISERMSGLDGRVNIEDVRIQDHEYRLRRVENGHITIDARRQERAQ